MHPLIPTITFEQLREAKKNTSKSLQDLGIADLSSSTAGNLVANIFGYKNWNTARALTSKNDAPLAETKAYADEVNTTQSITNGFDYNKLDPDQKEVFLQAIDEAVAGILMTHFVGLYSKNEDAELLKNLLAKALLSAYSIYEENTTLSEVISELRKINFPHKFVTDKNSILFQLSRSSLSAIMYFGKVVNAAKGIKAILKGPVENSELTFSPEHSSAIFAADRSEKTFLMLKWANSMQAPKYFGMDSRPCVYFISDRHRKQVVFEYIKEITPKEALDSTDASGIIFIKDDSDYAPLKTIIHASEQSGRHIFIDENPFLYQMLDEVTDMGYDNFTVAIQSVRDLFQHASKFTYKYPFHSILVGRHTDLAANRYFFEMGIDTGKNSLKKLGQGQFLLASYYY